MKRLYACIGFSMFITFTVVFYFELVGACLVSLVALVLAFMSLFVKRIKNYRIVLICIALVSILSNIYSLSYTNFVYEPQASKYINEVVDIKAEIISEKGKSYNTYFYEVDTLTINGKQENTRIMLKSPIELDVEYKDIIKAEVLLSECEYPIYKSQKVCYMAHSPEYFLDCEVTHTENRGIMYYPMQMRKALIHSAKTLIPGEKGDLCCGIAFGDKAGIHYDTLDNFKSTGLVHIIVVSGMHMCILVSFILYIMQGLPKLRGYNILRLVVVMAVIVIFVSITGFSRSAVRAGIMMTVVVLGQVIRRDYDGMNSLGFAAMIQSVFNPYIIADVGVLLSYSAVFGILLLYPMLCEKSRKYIPFKKALLQSSDKSFSKKFLLTVRKIIIYFVDLFLLSLSAVIFIMPVTAIFFETVSPWSVVLSLFIAIAIDVVLICTILCAVIWYIPFISFGAYSFALISYWFATYILFVINTGVNLGFTQFYVNSEVFIIWFVFSVILMLVAYKSINRKKNVMHVATVSMISIVMIFIAMNVITKSSVKMKFYPCGEGITTVFQENDSVNILSCGGNADKTEKIMTQIHKLSNKVDFMVVPSTTTKESRYARQILSEFDVKNILMYYMSSSDEEVFSLSQKCDNYYDFSQDDTYKIELTKDFTDVVFNVDNHTYQYVYSNDVSVLIIPSNGDCEEIPDKYISADYVAMCKLPDNMDMISYNEIIWLSDKEIPEGIENVNKSEDKVIEILLKK